MTRISLSRRQLLAALGGSALLHGMPAHAQPQSLPKVVRIVVPYAAGGGTDILARQLAEVMSTELGVQLIVENKAGGSTNIGTQDVIRSTPDGSTLLLGDLSLAVNPSLFKKLPFDPQKELTPVALAAKAPLVLVVSSSSGITSIKDLVARARANPGTLTFASAGNGNPPHLAGELFKLTTKTDIVNVPYKGVGPALNDLLGGHVAMMFTGISSTKAHIDAGKLNALAVTGPRRAPTLPGVPTMAEAGFATADVTSWWGVFAPNGVPAPLLAAYSGAIDRALRSPAFIEKLEKQNIYPSFLDAGSLRQMLQTETHKWAEVVRSAQLTAD